VKLWEIIWGWGMWGGGLLTGWRIARVRVGAYGWWSGDDARRHRAGRIGGGE